MTNLVAFLQQALRLKRIPRLGWALRGVPMPESVAEHTFGVALVALVLADALADTVDRGKVLALALVHDLPESVLGDIPQPARPHFPSHAKESTEAEIWRTMARQLPHAEAWIALHREYTEGETVEARLVKDADRLEMLLQALAYEQAGQRGLAEFWQPSAHTWSFTVSQQLFDTLLAERARLT